MASESLSLDHCREEISNVSTDILKSKKRQATSKGFFFPHCLPLLFLPPCFLFQCFIYLCRLNDDTTHILLFLSLNF